jgi:hypothetical protein
MTIVTRGQRPGRQSVTIRQHGLGVTVINVKRGQQAKSPRNATPVAAAATLQVRTTNRIIHDQVGQQVWVHGGSPRQLSPEATAFRWNTPRLGVLLLPVPEPKQTRRLDRRGKTGEATGLSTWKSSFFCASATIENPSQIPASA